MSRTFCYTPRFYSRPASTMRRTKAEAEQTRQNILAAALHLFDEQGYAQTSLNAIAERAGVTRGAIYGHFDNKDSILAALADAQFDELYAKNAAAIAAPDAWKTLADNLSAFFRTLHACPQRLRVLRIIHQQKHAGNNDIMEKLRCEREKLWHEQCREAVQRAKAAGEIPASTDAEYLFFHLTVTISGLIEYSLYAPDTPPPYIDRVIRTTITTLLQE